MSEYIKSSKHVLFFFAVFAGMLFLFLAFAMPSKAYADDMYRLYNPNSGEHLYTKDQNEYQVLGTMGWKREGVAWQSPESGDKVYRLYNPNSGDHHYTTDVNEYNVLGTTGWKQEGLAWYSEGSTSVYRLFNPNVKIGTHHYTTDQNEYNALQKLGWKAEGIGWYGVAPGTVNSVPETVSTPNSSSQPDTVYVTPTGKSYHRESCASTKNSKLTALTLQQAQSRGYNPCKLCFH